LFFFLSPCWGAYWMDPTTICYKYVGMHQQGSGAIIIRYIIRYMGVCAKEHPILGGWSIRRYPYVHTHLSLSLPLSLSLSLVSICLSIYLRI
jgi:hypothetical protein